MVNRQLVIWQFGSSYDIRLLITPKKLNLFLKWVLWYLQKKNCFQISQIEIFKSKYLQIFQTFWSKNTNRTLLFYKHFMKKKISKYFQIFFQFFKVFWTPFLQKKSFLHFWTKNNLLLYNWRATCPFDPSKMLFRGLFYKVSLNFQVFLLQI